MANLHVDVNIITQDLVDLVDGFRTSSHAHEKHKELSYKLNLVLSSIALAVQTR
jgi:hypothetical protein